MSILDLYLNILNLGRKTATARIEIDQGPSIQNSTSLKHLLKFPTLRGRPILIAISPLP